MQSNAKLIAVNEMSKSAGLITWWKLGGSVSLQTLQEKWDGDQSVLPRAVSEQAAMQRAARKLFEDHAKGRFIEKLPKTQGFAVVRTEHAEPVVGEAPPDPTYVTEMKVWLDDDDELQCRINTSSYGQPSEVRKQIWDAYNKALDQLDAADISTWLIRQAEANQSVRLREGGGIYFVPEDRVERWHKVSALIEASCYGASVYEVPAVRSEKAVEAILAALVAEATQELERIGKELSEQPLGKRGIMTRQSACSGILKKLTHYETLLGAKLTDVRGSVTALEGRLVEALMVVE